MAVFLDCLFENDYSGLVIDGNASVELINEAWNKIYLEYLHLSQSGNYNEVFEKTKEINVLNARLLLVESVCRHLELMYDFDMVAILEKLGLKPCITGKEDAKVLTSRLSIVLAKSKKWLVQIELKYAELKKLENKGETKAAGRDYYEEMLGALSKHQGFYIKETDITVARYCRGVKSMVELAQKQELKKK